MKRYFKEDTGYEDSEITWGDFFEKYIYEEKGKNIKSFRMTHKKRKIFIIVENLNFIKDVPAGINCLVSSPGSKFYFRSESIDDNEIGYYMRSRENDIHFDDKNGEFTYIFSI